MACKLYVNVLNYRLTQIHICLKKEKKKKDSESVPVYLLGSLSGKNK